MHIDDKKTIIMRQDNVIESNSIISIKIKNKKFYILLLAFYLYS